MASLAIEARDQHRLRHVPLLLCSILARIGSGKPAIVADTIEHVIQRADELAELIVIHAKLNGVESSAVKPILPAQMKKGLARAFRKFDEYQLAKYDRAGAVRLRDVLFLCHAKPKNSAQEALWERLIQGRLATPDTWEVSLSRGADKAETFTRLIEERKLGYLALLRNLRNMHGAGVDPKVIREALAHRDDRVLPFRYVAAARACPVYEPELDKAMSEAIDALPALTGETIILVDVSGSMDCRLSDRSDLRRIDAAAALASIIPGNRRVFTFSDQVKGVRPRRGMAGVDEIIRSQPHQGTELGKAIARVNALSHDRLIVITDEQTHGNVISPAADKAYLINVASYQNGVGYGRHWVHIDGFSENVIRYIHELES